MKKCYLLALLILSYDIMTVKAQFYSQGDISMNFQATINHDTNTCSTTGQLFYFITIQNSFVGDSVKVKDQFGGFVIYEESNISGQNPWNIMVPNFLGFGSISDYQLTGGFANFYGPDTKIISGPDTIYNISNFYGGPVSNICSYGNVTGKVYVDYNNDCTFNGSDVPLLSIPVSANIALNSPSSNATTSGAYSNTLGDYDMTVQQSWMTAYSVSTPLYYQFIFPPSVCSPILYNFNSLPQSSVDFSLQCSSIMDVRCGVFSSGVVRPGLPFSLSPYVNNTGCNAASGLLKLVINSNSLYDAGLSSNPANSIAGDTLIWNYSDLSNLSNGSYWNSFFGGVYLTPTNNVNIGDTLCFEVISNIPVGDVDPSNNTSYLCLPVVNSFDPNYKEVSPKGVGVEGFIPLSTSELTYTIHFQNTGNAYAYNISIIDTLGPGIDTSNIEILGATHPMMPEWLGLNIVKFNFYNIMLPDSGSNEPLSHGAVSFKIKLHSSMAAGTYINNNAYIFFDSNPEIVTNIATVTLAEPDGINDYFALNNNIKVYPNPFSDKTTFIIQAGNLNDKYSFELKDILGKTVRSINEINDQQFSISRNNLETGVYFYKIYSAETIIGVGKIIIN